MTSEVWPCSIRMWSLAKPGYSQSIALKDELASRNRRPAMRRSACRAVHGPEGHIQGCPQPLPVRRHQLGGHQQEDVARRLLSDPESKSERAKVLEILGLSKNVVWQRAVEGTEERSCSSLLSRSLPPGTPPRR